MIDKRIFYCWFGENELSVFEKMCIKSWRDQCPDYEIIEINESNFDVDSSEFAKAAYEHKNYAFVSDYARLWALSKQSGFYLDTDIRLIKSLDELRKYDAIVPMSGRGFYNNAPLGCSEFPRLYQDAMNNLQDGRAGNEVMNTLVYQNYDVYGRTLEVQDGIAFCGNDIFVTPCYKVNEHTIGLHYCHGSWLTAWQGKYDKKKSFKAFEIYQDGIRDKNSEKKMFGDVVEKCGLEVIGRMYTKGAPIINTHIFYANYFFNPKVIAVNGETFRLERMDMKLPSKRIEVEDVILECI